MSISHVVILQLDWVLREFKVVYRRVIVFKRMRHSMYIAVDIHVVKDYKMQIVKICLRMLSHDPNYDYGTDEEDSDNDMDTDDFGEYVFSILYFVPLFILIPTMPGTRRMMSTVMTTTWVGKCVGRRPSVWQPSSPLGQRWSQNFIPSSLQPSLLGSKVSINNNLLTRTIYWHVLLLYIGIPIVKVNRGCPYALLMTFSNHNYYEHLNTGNATFFCTHVPTCMMIFDILHRTWRECEGWHFHCLSSAAQYHQA